MTDPAEDALNRAAHDVEVITDRANAEAAEAYLKVLRALLKPHSLRRHQLTIQRLGLIVHSKTDTRRWWEIRGQDRGVGLVINTIGHHLDRLDDDFPQVFRRLDGTTL